MLIVGVIYDKFMQPLINLPTIIYNYGSENRNIYYLTQYNHLQAYFPGE